MSKLSGSSLVEFILILPFYGTLLVFMWSGATTVWDQFTLDRKCEQMVLGLARSEASTLMELRALTRRSIDQDSRLSARLSSVPLPTRRSASPYRSDRIVTVLDLTLQKETRWGRLKARRKAVHFIPREGVSL